MSVRGGLEKERMTRDGRGAKEEEEQIRIAQSRRRRRKGVGRMKGGDDESLVSKHSD